MFEKTTTDPDSTWNTDTPLPHAELHEVIKRIYDEKLSEEMFAPGEVKISSKKGEAGDLLLLAGFPSMCGATRARQYEALYSSSPQFRSPAEAGLLRSGSVPRRRPFLALARCTPCAFWQPSSSTIMSVRPPCPITPKETR